VTEGTVFFQDPHTHDWHELRWVGLPAKGEVPAFADARVTQLLDEARQRGLVPRGDADLLPLLLELIGANIPVERWPTQMSRKQRTDQAREDAQHTASVADRPGAVDTGGPSATFGAARQQARARWSQRAHDANNAVDEHRRHRREQAVPARPEAPARLGERLRRTSLLAPLPPEDTDGHAALVTGGDPR
jgi:hypothetical protein